MTNRHLRPDETEVEFADDLDQNPGIGQSKGLFARTGHDDADLIEGENTVEGDTENNADAAGAAKLDLGRTNK